MKDNDNNIGDLIRKEKGLTIEEFKKQMTTILEKCNELPYEDKVFILSNAYYVCDKIKKE